MKEVLHSFFVRLQGNFDVDMQGKFDSFNIALRKRASLYSFCRKVRVKAVLRSFLYIQWKFDVDMQGKFDSFRLAPRKRAILYLLDAR